MRKKHRSKAIEKYPIKCDLCNEQIENNVDLKKHMKKHSFVWVQFKCADCEFVGECELTMEVHNRKYHSENFECGICILFTCEIYQCLKCDEVNRSLSILKKHALETHAEFVEEKTCQTLKNEQAYNKALPKLNNCYPDSQTLAQITT